MLRCPLRVYYSLCVSIICILHVAVCYLILYCLFRCLKNPSSNSELALTMRSNTQYIVHGPCQMEKYLLIARTHHFVPVAIETSGAFGSAALELYTDIARRIRFVTLEVNARPYLIQRISVALQQGNAAAILGTSCVDTLF